MIKGKIAIKHPALVELEEGKTYYWCQCGESNSQPFCDGSHKSTEFQPVPFTVEKKGKKALCQCKQTDNKPYCDGTHTKL
ncbi:MAG: CDGSH iron-sulfur domain-containing protein [Candidatus Izimaplasma sp.]|nr:CDGSH iron-sulfur domain-containing protein [Candidatus Izimaplasma bacterium]